MADAKISALPELAEEPHADDEYAVVDKSDTTDAASGSTVRVKHSNVRSGLVPSTLVDAKGDLIVATADNTVARLAVGTNDHVLTADSAAAGGVKWAAAAGGGGGGGVPTQPLGPYAAADYGIPGSIIRVAAAGFTRILNVGRYILMPFSIPTAITVDAFATYCANADSPGNVRVAIYEATGTLDGTITLVSDAGVLDCSTVGNKKLTGLTIGLSAGNYFLVYQGETAVGLQIYRNLGTSWSLGSGNINQQSSDIIKTGTYGVMPATLSDFTIAYGATSTGPLSDCAVFMKWTVD